MSFLKKIFEEKSNVSSRRVIAIFFSFVLVPFILLKVDECDLLPFFKYIIYFLAILLGFTTGQHIVKEIKARFTQPNPDHEEH